MELAKSTKRFVEFCGTSEKPSQEWTLPELDLPIDPTFQSLPPRVSIEETLRFSEWIREWFPESIPTPERHWGEKSQVEFVFR
jgi:hypothetical protein